MDITAFVRELLFGHDCVIVPGFGGFLGNYTPARIDRTSGTFYPPSKQISFNRNLNHNDGLLIGKISGSANLSYGDTRNLVDEFVDEIRRKLGKGEKVLFDNLGSFVNNQEGNIQFEPDRSTNYYLDSFGLESFQCLPLEGYDVRKRIHHHKRRDPVGQTFLRKNLWKAAVIIPLLSVLVAVPLKTDLFKKKIESTTMNPLATEEFKRNNVDGVFKDESPKVESNSKRIPGNSTSREVVTPVEVEEKAYAIITGSFKSEENAFLQVNMLKAEGFTPEIVPAPNGFYRVCAIMCSDMNTAIIKKESIASRYPGSWVSKKK